MNLAPERQQVRSWLLEHGPVEGLRRVRESFPTRASENDLLQLSPALYLAARKALEEDPQAPAEALDSLPFYSLCRGLLLPLMNMPADRERRLFGCTSEVLNPEQRKELVSQFLRKPLGLKLPEKIGVILGDPFQGHAPGVREDSLTNVLSSLSFTPIKKVRQAIPQAGDLAGLFAMSRQTEKSDPPLATRVVLLALEGLHDFTLKERRELLRELYQQCGRLEAYCLTGLILNKLHLALSARQDYLHEILARQFNAPLDSVELVATLRDPFELCRILENEGPAGLDKVTIAPLSPLRPALAGATIDKDLKLPTWLECKYDGVRLMIHKDTDPQGRPLVAAYTRKRNDWVELIPGIRPLAQALPCQSVILDGELHGTVLSESGVPRPCTVYEVHEFLRGGPPVNLRYVGFDLLYLNGQDLTKLPFRERRRQLEALLAWPSQTPLPLPLAISQGSHVDTKEAMNRLYEQYRRQGHEGAMVKVEDAPYPVAERTNHWQKRKPEETLEMVITAAFWSDPTQAGQRMFDSYLLSCRDPQTGGLKEVATVGQLDGQTTMRLVQAIMGNNLLTGRPVEHKGSQRTASGVQLAPYLIVSVKYEAVVRDEDGEISLRSPRIAALRPGEMPLSEIASLDDLRRILLKQGLS